MTCLDLDDFCVGNSQLPLLDELKARVPDLKVTLFTIPCPTGPIAMSPLEHAVWLTVVRQSRPWLEFAVHGWRHTFLECRDWSKADALEVLQRAETLAVYARVFKAPYWETSPGLYDAIAERGWVIADHPRNDALRPAGLRVYHLGPGRAHGHVQNVCDNGLAEQFAFYASLQGPFKFVSEVMA